MEGDSWFEYPFFLVDITDNLMRHDNLVIYSMNTVLQYDEVFPNKKKGSLL